MLRFKLLLWALSLLLRRAIKTKPACASYVDGKELTFQIQTRSGVGRHYRVKQGTIRSASGLTQDAAFSLIFRQPGIGFTILSAKDAQAAFLRGLGNKDLEIEGNFLDVMWFQGLTNFLQPTVPIPPYEKSRFRS